jgi:hypothetical protein
MVPGAKVAAIILTSYCMGMLIHLVLSIGSINVSQMWRLRNVNSVSTLTLMEENLRSPILYEPITAAVSNIQQCPWSFGPVLIRLMSWSSDPMVLAQ